MNEEHVFKKYLQVDVYSNSTSVTGIVFNRYVNLIINLS